MNIDADMVSKNIFIHAVSDGKLEIMCNWCTAPYFYAFTGEDSGATLDGDRWLSKIIEHLLTEHSTQIKGTT